jgi:hypothetical protein
MHGCNRFSLAVWWKRLLVASASELAVVLKHAYAETAPIPPVVTSGFAVCGREDGIADKHADAVKQAYNEGRMKCGVCYPISTTRLHSWCSREDTRYKESQSNI